jgi:hypothetical protein
MLRRVGCWFITDVSGQPTDTIFNGHKEQEIENYWVSLEKLVT